MKTWLRSVPQSLAVLVACVFMAIGSQAAAQETAASAPKPNILIILMDDMGFSDIGAYGGEAETPNIDALAANGLRYKQFYQAARCCPTRASLLTGLHPHQAGMGHMANPNPGPTPTYLGYIPHDVPTIAEALRDHGYFTAMTGKWHVGGRPENWPINRGFDRVYGSPIGGVFYHTRQSLFHDDKLIYKRGDKLPDDFYGTDEWNDWATKYAIEAHEQGKPFFIYLAHVAPHFPCQAPQELIDKYTGRFMAGWEKMRESKLARQVEIGLFDEDEARLTEWPYTVPRWDSLSYEKKVEMDRLQAIYMATIEAADIGMGRLFDKLRETGQFDNTLILFLSDNGGNAEGGWDGHVERDRPDLDLDYDRVGLQGGPGIWPGQGWATLQNTPFRNYKHDTDEGGIRTPFIAHWPDGIDASLKSTWVESPGHLIDIMSTCLDVAGVPSEDWPHQEGISLRPTFNGEPLERDKPIYWEHEGNAAIRDGDWKLVREQGQGWRLYDLANDPMELENLAFDEPSRAADMAKRWQAWADEVGVTPYEVRNARPR